jgi:arylsulfatase A-like enzyme
MTFERQKQLCVVQANAVLTPRPTSLPAWDSIPAEHRRLFARMMEIFAGYGAHVDYDGPRH